LFKSHIVLISPAAILRQRSIHPALHLAANLKISSAAAIYPNSTIINTPTATLLACGVAVLFYHLHSTARVSLAIMPLHVIRRARHNLPVTRSVVAAIPIMIAVMVSTPATLVSLNYKIGPAAMIHPNATTVKSPSVALFA
jgi:hypothetical protein